MTVPAVTESYPVVVLRAYEPRDRAYIVDSWLKSYLKAARRTPEYVDRVELDYLRAHSGRIAKLLNQGMHVTVAFDPAYPDVICGWLAFNSSTLHYLYCRNELRRQGVARRLLASVAGQWAHSHRTPNGALLMASGLIQTKFRPDHFTGDASARHLPRRIYVGRTTP